MKCSSPMKPSETSHLICEFCWIGCKGNAAPDGRGDSNEVPDYAPCCFCGQTTKSRIYVEMEVGGNPTPRHCEQPRYQSMQYLGAGCENRILTITITKTTVHDDRRDPRVIHEFVGDAHLTPNWCEVCGLSSSSTRHLLKAK